jgi:hypothetical protein
VLLRGLTTQVIEAYEVDCQSSTILVYIPFLQNNKMFGRSQWSAQVTKFPNSPKVTC